MDFSCVHTLNITSLFILTGWSHRGGPMQEWDLPCQLCTQNDRLKAYGNMKVLYGNIAEGLNQHGMFTGNSSG